MAIDWRMGLGGVDKLGEGLSKLANYTGVTPKARRLSDIGKSIEGGDFTGAATRAIGAGDIDFGGTLLARGQAAKEAREQAQRWADQQAFREKQAEYQKMKDARSFALDEQRLGIMAAGQGKPPAGYRVTADGGLEAIPGGPADQSKPKIMTDRSGAVLSVDPTSGDVKVLRGPSAAPLTAGDRAAIQEAEDTAARSGNALEALSAADKLNEDAYSGAWANEKAWAARNLPGIFVGPETEAAGQATTEYENLVSGQALESLKSIFGGNPTEGERKALLDLQASVTKSPAERAAILKRFRALAERRIQFNRERARALRSGEYYQPGYDITGDGAPPTAPAGANDAAGDQAAPQGSIVTDPETGKRYEVMPDGTVYEAE